MTYTGPHFFCEKWQIGLEEGVNENPHVAWRMQIAQQIARRLQRYEGIQAIVVGGSVARGYADVYSDLEMPLFWDALPADALRLQIVSDLGAEFLYGYDGPANEDQVLIEGFQAFFWAHVRFDHALEQVVFRRDRLHSIKFFEQHVEAFSRPRFETCKR